MKIKSFGKKVLFFGILLSLLLPAAVGTRVEAAGFQKVKNGTVYIQKNGTRKKGWLRVGRRQYYFNRKGIMQTGWVRLNGKWRYFSRKSGFLVKNKTIGGKKIDKNGVLKGKFVVVIDPGHSGVTAGGVEPLGPGSSSMKSKDTSGTQGRYTGVPEYKTTLTIAKKLKKELTSRGYKVILTRTNHKKPLSCKERAMVANKAKADVLIRLHCNGSESSSAHGAMTICTTKNSPYVPELYQKSYRLSQKVLDSYVKATGARKEYIWETDSMSGNNWSKVPTTLIEMGYMTNPAEDKKMQKTSYQKKMVEGLADGIDAYFTNLKP